VQPDLGVCGCDGQVTKQQIEEKMAAVAVLQNAPGIDRAISQDVDGTLSTVMKLCSVREQKLHKALQLVLLALHMLSLSLWWLSHQSVD